MQNILEVSKLKRRLIPQERMAYLAVGLKRCSTCFEPKIPSEFHKNHSHKDKLDSRCKTCSKIRDRKKYINAHLTRKYKKSKIKSSSDWRKRNKEKVFAHSKLHLAVKLGRIIKPMKCEKCGIKGKLHGHHDNYSKPLSVLWVCVKCHEEIHHADTL